MAEKAAREITGGSGLEQTGKGDRFAKGFCTSLPFINFQADENVFQVVFGFVSTERVSVHLKAPCPWLAKSTHLDFIMTDFVSQTSEDAWLVPGKKTHWSNSHVLFKFPPVL